MYSTQLKNLWAHQDSNLEPADYESVARPLSYGPYKRSNYTKLFKEIQALFQSWYAKKYLKPEY